ncbi:hypothetical protein [Hymenobacter actinosclerus]|uniref:DUF4833 domain-containing protein n=1 Tax=Hymenobacter actinosclerus TaxID=82805 RepID=A0A1I0DLS5_9BACT|nr:hypothetical protein [Hymenobacter actinosclerus]SET33452.1 hypothetical protein SAMN04487998_1464 [Hymenobacter actinosclerus]
MKSLLFFALLLALPFAGLAQAPAGPTLNFCGLNLPLENGYTAVSSNEVTGPAYQLAWMYLDYSVMRTYPPEHLRLAKKKRKNVEVTPFTCTLLDGPPAQGTRLAYPTESGGMAYQYIVFGVAKGQPVLVDLTMPLDPEKTDDLPDLVQQFMRLEK